jgi:hypothetical protein
VIPAGSRYEEGERLWTEAFLYDHYQNPAYDGDPSLKRRIVERREAVYLQHTLPLPERPRGEYFVKDLEDQALLAFKFLEDASQWWLIAEVNSQVWYPLDMKLGDSIRVPGT